jgi:hypothetical protein
MKGRLRKELQTIKEVDFLQRVSKRDGNKRLTTGEGSPSKVNHPGNYVWN